MTDCRSTGSRASVLRALERTADSALNRAGMYESARSMGVDPSLIAELRVDAATLRELREVLAELDPVRDEWECWRESREAPAADCQCPVCRLARLLSAGAEGEP